MITELNKKFPNLERIDVQTGVLPGYGHVIITLKDQTGIYVRFSPDGVNVDIWEDTACLWRTRVARRRIA